MNESMTIKDRHALTIAEVASICGISMSLVRLEIKRNLLQPVRFGRRLLVLREELERYLGRKAR